MKLLAIPNDATSSYFRNYESDFLSEFNPKDGGSKRVFDEVKFLNWKDEESICHFGISSEPFLKDKSEAKKILHSLTTGSRKFKSPLFEDIFLKEIDSIDEFIKIYNPDILRGFNTHFAGELGNIIKNRYDIPLVISAHDPSRLTSIISKADSLVCISNDLAEKSMNDFGVDPSKIVIIPNGIDMDWFYPRNESGIGFESKYKILSVGRIVPSKNIESLLKAISILKEDFNDIKHIHLGKGTEESLREINKIKDNLKLGDISYFLGGKSKEDLPFYYSWADVYALPTLWEGLGRAQIESLACGTPVITTNYAPMNEIVDDGFNGLTANPKDPKDFAKKIASCFRDKTLMNYLKSNSRKSVYKRFNVNRVMKMNSDNYKQLLSS